MKYPKRKDKYNCDLLCENFHEIEHRLGELENGSGGGGDTPGGPGEPGVGIESIEQTTTSADDGGINVITATLTDGTVSEFEIRNGSKGSKGDKGDPGEPGKDGGDIDIDYSRIEFDTEEIVVEPGSGGSGQTTKISHSTGSVSVSTFNTSRGHKYVAKTLSECNIQLPENAYIMTVNVQNTATIQAYWIETEQKIYFLSNEEFSNVNVIVDVFYFV